jgi:hypothetical protein
MTDIKRPYLVKFDFTTYNNGGRFTGRSGQIEIESSLPEKDIDKDFVKQLCVNEVLRLKPTYKIFMLDIKSIEPINVNPRGKRAVYK